MIRPNSRQTKTWMRQMDYAHSVDVADALARVKADMLEHLMASGFSPEDAAKIILEQVDADLPGYRGLDKLAFAQRKLSDIRRNFLAA